MFADELKIAVLGASRGLGEALVRHIFEVAPHSAIFLSSRKKSALDGLARSGQDVVFAADYSRAADQDKVLESLKEFLPTHIFYVAGGGPFGAYHEKSFKDHEWAFEVSFRFAARVLHFVMSEPVVRSQLKQFVAVGSAVAGQKPDPRASSYAAAKHALRGLVTSVQGENPGFDIKLYEPGYMDTSLLPANAWPRQQGLAAPPADEARKLWLYSQS